MPPRGFLPFGSALSGYLTAEQLGRQDTQEARAQAEAERRAKLDALLFRRTAREESETDLTRETNRQFMQALMRQGARQPVDPRTVPTVPGVRNMTEAAPPTAVPPLTYQTMGPWAKAMGITDLNQFDPSRVTPQNWAMAGLRTPEQMEAAESARQTHAHQQAEWTRQAQERATRQAVLEGFFREAEKAGDTESMQHYQSLLGGVTPEKPLLVPPETTVLNPRTMVPSFTAPAKTIPPKEPTTREAAAHLAASKVGEIGSEAYNTTYTNFLRQTEVKPIPEKKPPTTPAEIVAAEGLTPGTPGYLTRIAEVENILARAKRDPDASLSIAERLVKRNGISPTDSGYVKAVLDMNRSLAEAKPSAGDETDQRKRANRQKALAILDGSGTDQEKDRAIYALGEDPVEVRAGGKREGAVRLQTAKQLRQEGRKIGEDLASSRVIVDEISALSQKVNTFGSVGRVFGAPGREAGVLTQANQDATRLRQQAGFLANLARSIGGERGVLTNQDIDRVQGLVPGIHDTAQIAQDKIRQVRAILQKGERRARWRMEEADRVERGEAPRIPPWLGGDGADPGADEKTAPPGREAPGRGSLSSDADRLLKGLGY